MAPIIQTDIRPKYSWWWDSHIPKNSKWLQENLTDMDSKVQAMIKLIEEDADSFARRAEMYYKKRPELMKLVEEFYRAYRALAERYDQSTGALRQAHRTMAEAFPNQVPFLLPDDSPSSSSVTDPHTPEMTRPIRASHDPDDLAKDALLLSSSQFSAFNRDEFDEIISKGGLKQFDNFSNSGEEAGIRKGLKFHGDDPNDFESEPDCQTLKSKVAVESLRAGKAESELQTLKETLAKLEAEKEAGLLHYQKSLESLANMEAEVSQAKKDARGLEEQTRKAESEVQTLQKALAKLEAEKEAGDFQYRFTLEKLSTLETELSHVQEAASELNERTCKAETEVLNLKESLAVLEAEKEASLLQYQRCLDKISHLEAIILRAKEETDGLNERASKAETEAQTLKQSLTRLEAEKEACIVQYKQCMETISNLESKLSHAENDAVRLNERADLAESEIRSLKHAISELNEEKEATVTRYQNSMVTISNLESEISHAQAETKRLNTELAAEVEKLNDAEKQYLRLEKENHSLRMELESVVHKTEMQRRALLVKQEELERLRHHVHEESMRAIQAEAALQALQKLHSNSQEAQRNLTVEIQKGSLMLKDMEHWSNNLQLELQHVKEENKSLNVLNSSSSLSINNMQEEIYRLKEMTRKLQDEVGLRLDQRNALQQEIYCLKQEIYDLNRRHQGVIEQVESVGLKPESLGSSVKKLQDDNSQLKEVILKERDEKLILLQKLENMEKILEKNALLEISLTDLSAELEAIREKVKALEESCHSFQLENSVLVVEKSSLVSQLESSAESMEKLSKKNAFLENSLSDTTIELESIKTQSKSLQESCQSLDNERSNLLTDRDTLVSHLKEFQETLAELEKKYTELEEKCSVLEKEKESTFHQVEELRASLNLEKQEHARFSQSSEIRLSRLEDQIFVLQKEDRWRTKKFEEEQESTIKSQVEIFILQKCIRDMEEKNFLLLIECEKHFEESKMSEKLISVLEQEYHEQQLEVKSLLNQLQNLRSGIRHVLESINTHPDYKPLSKIEDQVLLNCILKKIEDAESSLLRTQDEKQLAVFENLVLVTLLGQMRLEISNAISERNILDQEFKVRLEELMILQNKEQELFHMNGQMRLEAETAAKREEVLKDELNNLHVKFLNLQDAYTRVLNEKFMLCEENRSMMKNFSVLEKEKCMLEEENGIILGEAIALGNLSVIYKSFSDDKTMELKALVDGMDHIHNANDGFMKEIEELKEALELVETENLHLKESVDILGSELNTASNANDQFNHQLGIENETLIHRDMELSEAAKRLNATQIENIELHRNVEELQRECREAKFTREELERQVLKLSNDNTRQNKEIGLLKEVNLEMESKFAKLQEEFETHRSKEESLSSELLERRHDIKLHEEVTATLFGDLQCYTVCASVFRESVQELLRACQSLGVEGYSNGGEIKRLKERLDAVETENGVLKSNFAAYLPIIASLKESLASLKDHILVRTKILADNNQDAGLGSYQWKTSCQKQNKEDPDVVVSDEVSGLRELQTMVKAVEMAVIEMERHALQESLVANMKVEAAMKEIENLKSAKRSIRDANGQTSNYIVMELDDEKLGDTSRSLRQQKVEPEVSVVSDRDVMKDIPLDQVMESSSYDISLAPHTSRREPGASEDKMLKLWETTEKSGRHDNLLDKAEKLVPRPLEEDSTTHQTEPMEELKSEYPSSELQAEKELGMDKHEISKRFKDTRQGSRRKILERLTSDAQKLTNIQITIEDLKKKMETSNKSKKSKGIDYETLREQLKEVEVSIMQLVDINVKLSSKTKGSPVPFEGKAADEGEESLKVRKRRITEQARKGSEQIGRLQLEVQRIQFAMLKLEEEHAVKGVSSSKRSTGVRLRDYLSGSGKSFRRKKKGPCCACVRPPLPDESS